MLEGTLPTASCGAVRERYPQARRCLALRCNGDLERVLPVASVASVPFSREWLEARAYCAAFARP